mmetsp:Transcript_73923/g.117096  ORF Transcript_73923/g.117096 Transcript_73923/m.117096 type:complete len:582 (+) Transcript_73923:61-1806(+)
MSFGDWQSPSGGGFDGGGGDAFGDQSQREPPSGGRSYEMNYGVPRLTTDSGSFGDEESRSIAKAFSMARGPDGFVHAEEGKRQLQKTGLPNETLHNIWDLSDLDRDGRLSLREFVCAMHLASEAKQHRPLPSELDHRYQEVLVRNVERLVATGVSHGFEDAGGKMRPEEWSTTDTRNGRLGAFDTNSSGANFDSHRSEDRYAIYEEDRKGVRDLGSVGVGSKRTGLGFDAAGDLGRRGRDPTPRSVSGQRVGDHGRRSPISESLGLPDPGAGLGQLASVFEVTARLDATGELRRISREVLEERRNLEQQLARRRDFERQLQEVRGQLEALREERRRVEVESSASQRHAAHLQDELGFVEREVKDSEQDLNALRESADTSRIRRGPAPYSSAEEERRDVLSKVRAEKELLQRDQRSIEELRLKLEDVFKDKLDAQVLQQQLLEKQRQSEQDRGLMLTAIEAERSKLSAMRAERIRMWEERSGLEREMTDIMQERWLAEHRGPPSRAGRPEKDFKDGMGVPIGVPTEQYYRSAPGDLQKNEVGNTGSVRRDGNYRSGMQGGMRVDAKGVRNEDALAFGSTPFN